MRFVILAVIMVVSVLVGFFALQFASSPKVQTTTTETAGSASVNTVDVLVARGNIPVGTVINEQMVDRQPWPQHLVNENFITASGEDANIVGMVTRSDFQAQEPFNMSKLARPNDSNFLAANLEKGMRAVTIPVDAISGVAGYIFPGDHVDVLLTHAVPLRMLSNAGSPASDKPFASEMLIPNVKILAVDIRSTQKPDQRGAARAPANITLEVSAEDAQRLRLAEKNGTLSLSLRSLKDKDDNYVSAPSVLPALTSVDLQSGGGGSAVNIIRGVNRASTTNNPLASLANRHAVEEVIAPPPSVPQSNPAPSSPSQSELPIEPKQ